VKSIGIFKLERRVAQPPLHIDLQCGGLYIIATTGSLVNSFRYTGREWDTETSLFTTAPDTTIRQMEGFLVETQSALREALIITGMFLTTLHSWPIQRDSFPRVFQQHQELHARVILAHLTFKKAWSKLFSPGRFPKAEASFCLFPARMQKKILDNSLSYYTGHFWDGNPNGWDTWNPFLFWDPLLHSGGSEVRSKLGLHFRVKYGKNCDKTCTLDEFHIDEHNPLFDPLGHVLNDIPKAIGKGLGIR